MTSETDFFGRIRGAIGTRPELSETPPIGEPLVRLCRHADDAAATFIQHARASGMMVTLTTRAELPQAVASALAAWSTSTACALAAHSPEDLEVIRRLAAGFAQSDPAMGDALFAPGVVGVTDTFAAIAETGSIVMASSATMPRAVFLVPDRHLAIVHASRVLPDLFDLFSDLNHPPAAMTIVTGPSKTADIEGILITGVHGPREVHVIFVTDA